MLEAIRAAGEPLEGVGAVCHWGRSVCALPPQWYVTWNEPAGEPAVELFCQRHYVLTLDWMLTVHRAECHLPLADHVVARGQL